MARRIVSTGRGGARKSSFSALVSRYLKPPMLLIDWLFVTLTKRKGIVILLDENENQSQTGRNESQASYITEKASLECHSRG
jgi:hypothetical protein